MLKIPQLRSLAINAAPTAAAGKIRRSKKLLRAVTERLLNQRTLLDAFKTRRGANTSHIDMSTTTPAKNANRTRTALSIMNMFINIYTLRSLPQFLILSFWLVQNLSSLTEGFPTSGNDTENKYSISDALRSLLQGIHFRNSPTFYGRITDSNINLASLLYAIFCENLCRTDSDKKFRATPIFFVFFFAYIIHSEIWSSLEMVVIIRLDRII